MKRLVAPLFVALALALGTVACAPKADKPEAVAPASNDPADGGVAKPGAVPATPAAPRSGDAVDNSSRANE